MSTAMQQIDLDFDEWLADSNHRLMLQVRSIGEDHAKVLFTYGWFAGKARGYEDQQAMLDKIRGNARVSA